MKWILIFAFAGSPQSQPVAIEFDDRIACQSAGRLLEERAAERFGVRKVIWICVPKGKVT